MIHVCLTLYTRIDEKNAPEKLKKCIVWEDCIPFQFALIIKIYRLKRWFKKGEPAWHYLDCGCGWCGSGEWGACGCDGGAGWDGADILGGLDWMVAGLLSIAGGGISIIAYETHGNGAECGGEYVYRSISGYEITWTCFHETPWWSIYERTDWWCTCSYVNNQDHLVTMHIDLFFKSSIIVSFCGYCTDIVQCNWLSVCLLCSLYIMLLCCVYL